MNTKFPICIFLFCAYFSNAQNLDSLIVESLTPSEIPSTENNLDISTSTTIISAEEIFERGYDNLDELLSSVQGVFISHDRTLTQISLRGPSPTASNNQRIQVLLDGLPLNNPFSGQASSGYDLRGINMEDIEEVIVQRNPSPIENGNNAMIGVVKINTKKPKKGLRLNFDTGSYGELDGGFSVGQSFGKANIGLSGRLADIKGQELFFPGDSILTKEATDYAGTRMRFNLGKFSFNTSYYRRNEAISAIPNNPFEVTFDTSIINSSANLFKEELDIDGNLKEHVLFFDANFSTAIGRRQSMDIRLFLNYKNTAREQSFRDTELNTDTMGLVDTAGYFEYIERPQQRTLWTGLDYRHRFRLRPNNELNFGLSIVLLPISKYENTNELFTYFDGLDTIKNDFGGSVLGLVKAKEENYNKNFSYWSVAFFVEDKLQLSELLILNIGGRIEINSQTKPVFAPQVAIQFSPFEKSTNFHFGFSRGYRLPTIQETDLVISDNLLTAPNPNPSEDLIPETSNNFELGWKQKIGKDFVLDLAFYHQQLNDLIWNETTMINRQNDEVIKATGLEGGLGVNLSKGVNSYFNYNFQFDKKEKVNLPSPLCKFGITIPFLKHFTLFAEGQYEGARLTFDGSFTQPFFLMNTNLLIRPKVEAGNWLESLSLSFRLFNMFDEFYQHPSGQQFSPNLIPQNGRTWQTQLTYQF